MNELPFITAPPLADGQQEAYLLPDAVGHSGTLYEHCCRALDRGLTTGPHGLPLIGCGDWNDGFSRVGQQGRGESVWLGFFIDYVLQRMLPICRSAATRSVSRATPRIATSSRDALNSAGWDGDWYRRAYYDNGQPIGSADERRMPDRRAGASLGGAFRRRAAGAGRHGDATPSKSGSSTKRRA